jgi:hypothetical protein
VNRIGWAEPAAVVEVVELAAGALVDVDVVDVVVDVDVDVDVDEDVVAMTASSVGGGATVDVVDGVVLCSWNLA